MQRLIRLFLCSRTASWMYCPNLYQSSSLLQAPMPNAKRDARDWHETSERKTRNAEFLVNSGQLKTQNLELRTSSPARQAFRACHANASYFSLAGVRAASFTEEPASRGSLICSPMSCNAFPYCPQYSRALAGACSYFSKQARYAVRSKVASL
jgi:hypothetical protein